MTAQVAILNRSAVALAADSAMTFGPEGAEKTYPENKLFTLSKFFPVGIMIYNSASHMGVPLETIIKIYRQRAWDTPQPTVRDYANKFITYLTDPKFCTDDQVSLNVQTIFQSICYEIRKNANKEIQRQFEKTGKVPKQALGRIIANCIREKREKLEELRDNESIKGLRLRNIISRYQSAFDKAVNSEFSPLPVSKKNKDALKIIARLAVAKDYFTDGHTGLVFAGFGQDEIFPSLIEVWIDGVIDNKLKVVELTDVDISRQETDTFIRAFAQKEMVERFMGGIDPLFEKYITMYVNQIMKRFSDDIIDSHVTGSIAHKDAIKDQMNLKIENLINSLIKFSQRTQRENFAEDIVTAVSLMPKPEMAHMAEALVNLTSIKRRVSTDKETVGGPVDVAVISKGDGFVWIKRKHYFPSDINLDFMKKYHDERC